MRRKGSKDNSESPHGAVRKGKEKKREGARAQGKGKDVRKDRASSQWQTRLTRRKRRRGLPRRREDVTRTGSAEEQEMLRMPRPKQREQFSGCEVLT